MKILLLTYLFVYLFFGDDISVSRNMHLGLELWNLWISSPWFTKQPFVYHKSHSITMMWWTVYNQQKMLRETRTQLLRQLQNITFCYEKQYFAIFATVLRYTIWASILKRGIRAYAFETKRKKKLRNERVPDVGSRCRVTHLGFLFNLLYFAEYINLRSALIERSILTNNVILYLDVHCNVAAIQCSCHVNANWKKKTLKRYMLTFQI